MELNNLLWITIIIYLIIMGFAYVFKIKWLYMLAGVLWFIPLVEIDNAWIMIISVIMLITHFTMGLREQNDDF